MHLMVYAEYGRIGVYMLQEYARCVGVGDSDEEISDFANTLLKLPQDHPLARLLGRSLDFRSKAGLADALLHPLDRAYTVPQLFEFIKKAGLIFGRWVWQAPYSPQCAIIADTPHGLRLAKLSQEEGYAAVELFRGTISRHSFIAFRDDDQGAPQPIHFDGDEWKMYIPIRQPGVVCIQKHLPPGAAAVLVNQDHEDTDLVNPINPLEKRLFDEIDGRRTITDIMKRVISSSDSRLHLEGVRNLFERLWQYDHVVFDASNQD
jgi:hypothetical protein